MEQNNHKQMNNGASVSLTILLIGIVAFASGFLCGLLMGHYTYDDIKAGELDKYKAAFDVCRDRYNYECVSRPYYWTLKYEDFNVTEHGNNTEMETDIQ